MGPRAVPRARVGLSVLDSYWQHYEPVAFKPYSAAAGRVMNIVTAGYRVAVPDWCECSASPSVSRRDVFKYVAAAPIMLGLGTAASGLVQPPSAAADPALVVAVEAPGQAANIITCPPRGARRAGCTRRPIQ